MNVEFSSPWSEAGTSTLITRRTLIMLTHTHEHSPRQEPAHGTFDAGPYAHDGPVHEPAFDLGIASAEAADGTLCGGRSVGRRARSAGSRLQRLVAGVRGVDERDGEAGVNTTQSAGGKKAGGERQSERPCVKSDWRKRHLPLDEEGFGGRRAVVRIDRRCLSAQPSAEEAMPSFLRGCLHIAHRLNAEDGARRPTGSLTRGDTSVA